MARFLKPLVRSGGYYPSRRWTPLVYPGGYTTANGGEEPAPPPIEKTVTGNPIHILDALAKPAQALSVKLEPVQDLHGYSYPWPAGGGKNKFNGTFLQGYWAYAGGGWVYSNGWIATEKIPCKPSTSYTASADAKLTRWQGFVWYDSNGDFISTDNLQSNANIGLTKTSPSNAAYLIFNIAGYPNSTDTIALSDVTHFQLEEGSASTAYSPYANICPISGWTGANVYHSGADTSDATTYYITFPSEAGTVYGGTLDVTTGKLTVTHANIASYNGESINEPWISSMDAYVAGTTPTTGAQVVYKLATPITYDLTPTEVTLLLGENNIWSDGEMTLTYLADGNASDEEALNP